MSLGLVAFILSAVAIGGCSFLSPSIGQQQGSGFGLFKYDNGYSCKEYPKNHQMESKGSWRWVCWLDAIILWYYGPSSLLQFIFTFWQGLPKLLECLPLYLDLFFGWHASWCSSSGCLAGHSRLLAEVSSLMLRWIGSQKHDTQHPSFQISVRILLRGPNAYLCGI